MLYTGSMKETYTVIFDFDGTLANTLELVARIYNEHHKEFGSQPIDMSELATYQKLGYKKAAKKAGIKWYKIPKIIRTISHEMKQHMDEVEPFPGVIALVGKLQKEGVSVGVLTSNSHELVTDYFASQKFPEFDFVVSEKTLFSKEKALRNIIEHRELDPQRVVYVGDEPRDVTSCHKAGIRVIGVDWGVGGVEGLTPVKPHSIVHTTKELHSEITALRTEG